MAERQPCRCLLAEGWPDLAQSVAEAISLMPQERRAPELLYRQRLDICLACPWLRDGTCGKCGCYVQARAAARAQRCPDLPPRWMPEA